jgi:hypothetical protein
MIDKFLAKYDEFNKHNLTQHLDDADTIALFRLFCEQLGPKATPAPQPVQTQAQATSTRRPGRGSRNRVATDKQVNLIRSLQGKGHLDKGIDFDELSVASASALIDKGIQAQKAAKNKAPQPQPAPQPVPAEEDEEKGAFTGSYNHQSSGHESQAHFWE